jgi:hypothetical protein
MKKCLVIIAILIVQFLLQENACAQFTPWSARQGPSSLKEKSDAKYQDIWSLSDWFETQRRVRLMDQWLALNSSSNPFEFYLGGQTTKYERLINTNGADGLPKNFNITQGTFGAFASIIGLQAQYTAAPDNYTQGEGTIHLRLLGRSQQGTNLTGFYGVRKRIYDEKSYTTQKETVQQQMAGGSITLNLTKFFGIQGTFKNYYKHKTNLENELSGHRIEGTAFIDFLFVRVYGTWFEDQDKYITTATPNVYKVRSRGILGGLQLWF